MCRRSAAQGANTWVVLLLQLARLPVLAAAGPSWVVNSNNSDKAASSGCQRNSQTLHKTRLRCFSRITTLHWDFHQGTYLQFLQDLFDFFLFISHHVLATLGLLRPQLYHHWDSVPDLSWSSGTATSSVPAAYQHRLYKPFSKSNLPNV